MIKIQEPAYAMPIPMMGVEVNSQMKDWREPIKQFLVEPRPEADLKLKRQGVRYVLIDQQLYR